MSVSFNVSIQNQDMKKKQKSGLSQSFIMGIISMVFLVIGYQTALFLHHSAVARIQATRDHPDTVYVYRDIPDDKSYPDTSATAHVERKVSAHSSQVTSVRKKIPLKRICIGIREDRLPHM